MANYNIKINLLKFKNSCVVKVKGNNSTKVGVFIPIEDNGLFVSVDENLNAKAVYTDLTAWESRESKYGDSHGIKLSLPKEMKEKMSEEELKLIPFVGNMKPIEPINASSNINIQSNAVVEQEDEMPLPF